MFRIRLIREWLAVLIASSLVIGLVAWSRLLEPIDLRLLDTVQTLRAPPPDERILVVEIDDASLARLGRWPWPRALHAATLDRLTSAGARAVGYDVLFLEPSADDAALAAALARNRRTRLAALVDYPDKRPDISSGAWLARPRLVPPIAMLAAAAAGVDPAEIMLDRDGLVRRAEPRLSTDRGLRPQLPARLAMATGAPAAALPDPFLIDYIGRDGFRHVSFAALAAGEVPASLIAGRTVLVGVTASGLANMFAVPQHAGGLLPAVEIEANVLQTQLGGRPARQLGSLAGLAFALAPAWLAMALYLRLRASAKLQATMALALAVVTASCALFWLGRLWLGPATGLLGLGIVHALWSWRRLSAISGFITAEGAALDRDPDLAGLPLAEPGLRLASGAELPVEARHLHSAIARLRHMRGFIGAVVDNLPDATCVLGAHGTIELANAAAQRLGGGTVSGLTMPEFLARVSPGEGNGPLVHELRRVDGTTLMITEAALSPGGRIIRLADVTELQRDANEREELVQFLSHDMRAPNATILTLLASLHDSQPEAIPPHLRPLIERIESHARHGLRLADDFVQLARARRRTLHFDPLDLCDTLQEAAGMAWPAAARRGIQLADTSTIEELWLTADRSMLLRAAINLLDNAVKFAPDHATITYAASLADGMARIAVSGPGPELPEGRRHDPFGLYGDGLDVTGHESLGLGLAFVQATARRHGGHASYRHIDGYGACFELAVPARAAD